uniref:Reverse transcriptase domain-containing protein n=1 Tax=Moniliophthora roreri TaxID=221103 RepID=A0A0W0FEH4_MONRR
MASPFFFVAKKEAGALRPCQDYQDLNNGTIKNRYPLPLVTDLVDKLKNAKVFTKLDLQNSYNNIRIKDGDQWKAAFKTPHGLFKPTVMFFRLTNSPATFQAFMNDILKDFINEGWCIVYMDDILIFSDDLELHQLCTHRVLERLRENDLFLKPEKCKFEVAKMFFLGLIITPGHKQMDPMKLAEIAEWEAPTTVKGAVLRQKGPDGELHPCGYISHAFTLTERNYEIYDRELLAIVNALKVWQHYLLGAPHLVTILSDHKNLTYFRTAQKLNRQQAQWSLFLTQFDLQLVHVPGTKMAQSDALSWRPDLIDAEENDNEDTIMLPDKLFVNIINVELRDSLEKAMSTDDFHQMTLENLIEHGTTPIKSSLQDWRIDGDLLFYKDWCYVPNDEALRQTLVKKIHKALPHGHSEQ